MRLPARIAPFLQLGLSALLSCCLAASQRPLPESGLRLHPAATLGANNSYYSLVFTGTGDKSFSPKYPDAVWGDTEAVMKWGLIDYVDVGGKIPYHFDLAGEGNQMAQGDVRIYTKFIYPPYPHTSFFDLAFYGDFSIPTGSKTTGYFARKFTNDKYAFTSGNIDFTVLVLGSFDFRKFGKGAPLSLRFNLGEEFTGKAVQEDFYRAGLGFTFFVDPRFEWLVEFSGETKAISGISPAHDPLRFSSGARFHFRDFEVTLGGDFSLTDTDVILAQPAIDVGPTRVQPGYQFSLALSYLLTRKQPADPDSDKVFGVDDKCPSRAEDFDGHEDQDGCPDYDNDRDGVPDDKDGCPNQSEDLEGFQDGDGCPDFDNDADGIMDSLDACANEKEDIDGHEDNDGCPDMDNDGDEIPDLQDKCPNQKEDVDSHEDNDGCADYDNDADGTPDSLDKCPDQKETFNQYRDSDGCPDTRPKEIKVGRTVLGNVRFVKGSAMWKPGAKKELELLVASLRAYPKVTIEIHGHTDSFGSRSANQALSEKMSHAVRDYLIRRGIKPERLAAKGFGESSPLVPNTSAEGREMNRRIEVHRKD